VAHRRPERHLHPYLIRQGCRLPLMGPLRPSTLLRRSAFDLISASPLMLHSVMLEPALRRISGDHERSQTPCGGRTAIDYERSLAKPSLWSGFRDWLVHLGGCSHSLRCALGQPRFPRASVRAAAKSLVGRFAKWWLVAFEVCYREFSGPELLRLSVSHFAP
jgi:hypothetical protein